MKLVQQQQGNSPLIAVILVAVIAAVGVAGYRVMQSGTSVDDSSVQKTSKQVPAKFNNQADIKKADRALDSSNVDTDVNPNSLNNDIDNLL